MPTLRITNTRPKQGEEGALPKQEDDGIIFLHKTKAKTMKKGKNTTRIHEHSYGTLQTTVTEEITRISWSTKGKDGRRHGNGPNVMDSKWTDIRRNQQIAGNRTHTLKGGTRRNMQVLPRTQNNIACLMTFVVRKWNRNGSSKQPSNYCGLSSVLHQANVYEYNSALVGALPQNESKPHNSKGCQ